MTTHRLPVWQALTRGSARIVFACVLTGMSTLAHADWPMWRGDATRSGFSAAELPAGLQLQWVRQLPAPHRAWPEQWSTIEQPDANPLTWMDDGDKLAFDTSYEPVAAGQLLFVPSMVRDSVTAYNTRTGEQVWRVYVDGPVRFAPAVWQGRVYFVSDDGFLYCVDAATGERHWRFRGGPADRLLLGNERLINAWPARGAPVVRDGVVYFAAGIWPFEGIFIHALDAATGDVRWTNSDSGSRWSLHQHGGAMSFGGVAPQGYMAATDDKLLVSGGLTVPAVFDRATGEFKYFRFATTNVGKGAGGFRVMALGQWFFNHGDMYSLDDGAQYGDIGMKPFVLTENAIIGVEGRRNRLTAIDKEPDVKDEEIEDRLARRAIRNRYDLRTLWSANLPEAVSDIHIMAGSRLFGVARDGQTIVAITPPADGQPLQMERIGQVDGAVWTMLAADERLFVVTKEGALYCFGAQAGAPRRHELPDAAPRAPADAFTRRAAEIVQRAGSGGYALMLGAGSGRLLDELVRQSEMHIVVIEPDANKVEALRQRLDREGVYGMRVSALAADPIPAPLPPYFASLIVVEDAEAAGLARGEAFVQKLFYSLRPYGGRAELVAPPTVQDDIARWATAAALPGATIERHGDTVSLARSGPLPGAASWTHEYRDAANTSYSEDEHVKAPLGILWFGARPTNEAMLPRHGDGPVPQVVGGRIIVMGERTVSARDVYTGRELWVVDLPGIGEPYLSVPTRRGTYLPHRPGSNFVGSRYVSVEDGVYVVYGTELIRLDPATGRKMSAFRLRANGGALTWGNVRVWDDLLIAAVEPQTFDDTLIGDVRGFNATSSRYLMALNRHTGDLIWQREARIGFRHNAIACGGGIVFAIDHLTESALELLERRGGRPAAQPRLLALDARTGEELWSTDDGVFGTWVSYCARRDLLLQAGRPSGGTHNLPGEPNDRMMAYRGRTGEVLWDRQGNYIGPLALHESAIVAASGSQGTSAPFLNVATGEPILRPHPITDEDAPIAFSRFYGCGTGITSKYLTTFRSGAAGYFDIESKAGSGNLGGFRAGCTNNLVAADGVLNAPDYTRTCTCSYQNRTSLALIHRPDVEVWTFDRAMRMGTQPLKRAGINLGAPGCRLAADGVYWANYPDEGVPAPRLNVDFRSTGHRFYGAHASSIADAGASHAWVAAYGVEGNVSIDVSLPGGNELRRYTVTLHFAEPGAAAPGERVFSVKLQERHTIGAIDIAAEAQGPRRALVKRFEGVEAGNSLTLELTAAEGAKYLPVLSGIELRQEGE